METTLKLNFQRRKIDFRLLEWRRNFAISFKRCISFFFLSLLCHTFSHSRKQNEIRFHDAEIQKFACKEHSTLGIYMKIVTLGMREGNFPKSGNLIAWCNRTKSNLHSITNKLQRICIFCFLLDGFARFPLHRAIIPIAPANTIARQLIRIDFSTRHRESIPDRPTDRPGAFFTKLFLMKTSSPKIVKI